jgi:hypothetical protein
MDILCLYIKYTTCNSIIVFNILFHMLKFKNKVRTIEELHSLYLRARERGEKRRKELCDYIDNIVKEIPENSKGERNLYYKRGDDIWYYTFRFIKEVNSYGYSENFYQKNQNVVDNRDSILDILLLSDENWEMGKKFRNLKMLSTNFQYIVLGKMWNIVENDLRKKFKGIRPPNVFVIQICDKKYFVTTGSECPTWKFNFSGEFDDKKIIKI